MLIRTKRKGDRRNIESVSRINKISLGVALFSLAIAVISVFFAGGANSLSKQANSIASDATELQHRPWLMVNVALNKETGNFFDIVKEENEIHWKLSIIIENKGATPAINISVPRLMNLKDISTIDEYSFLELNDIVLGQGEKYSYDFSLIGGVAPDKDIDQLFERFRSKAAPLQFAFTVNYYYNREFRETWKDENYRCRYCR